MVNTLTNMHLFSVIVPNALVCKDYYKIVFYNVMKKIYKK